MRERLYLDICATGACLTADYIHDWEVVLDGWEVGAEPIQPKFRETLRAYNKWAEERRLAILEAKAAERHLAVSPIAREQYRERTWWAGVCENEMAALRAELKKGLYYDPEDPSLRR